MIDTSIEVDLSTLGVPLFSVIDEAFGACDDTLDVRLQAELKAAFQRHCHQIKKPMGERLRELIALDALGQAHVRSLVEKRFSDIGLAAVTVAPSDVRTSDKTV